MENNFETLNMSISKNYALKQDIQNKIILTTDNHSV